MLAPNLMLLFLPVPHTSLVPWLTGLSRNRLIRYHRWLGHGTMWILTTHAVLYYVYWGACLPAMAHPELTGGRFVIDWRWLAAAAPVGGCHCAGRLPTRHPSTPKHTQAHPNLTADLTAHPNPNTHAGVSDRAGGFWDNFSLWADKGGVNNLAGSLAFFAGLVLWATALTWVRRRFFRVRCCFFSSRLGHILHCLSVLVVFLGPPPLLLGASGQVEASRRLPAVPAGSLHPKPTHPPVLLPPSLCISPVLLALPRRVLPRFLPALLRPLLLLLDLLCTRWGSRWCWVERAGKQAGGQEVSA